MKKEIPAVKKSHPNLNHKQAFSMAAKNWSKKNHAVPAGMVMSKKSKKARKARKSRKSNKRKKNKRSRK
jgi:hypothetical protein